MGVLHRFYVPESEWNEAEVVLRGDEAHHCRNVLRHAEGDEVEVFQGRGVWALARIVSKRKAEVELEVLRVNHQRPYPVAVTLVQALPKGKLMDWIVQKATEIGVARIVPLVTERTVARPEDEESKRAKWRRVALEACKQCGQNWLPEVAPVHTVAEFLREDKSDGRLVAALSPEARRLRELAGERLCPWNSLAVVIGPEGDFSPEELERFREARAEFLSLGPAILRTETAAIYALSVISQEYFLKIGEG